jgi:hypothetical protein
VLAINEDCDFHSYSRRDDPAAINARTLGNSSSRFSLSRAVRIAAFGPDFDPGLLLLLACEKFPDCLGWGTARQQDPPRGHRSRRMRT